MDHAVESSIAGPLTFEHAAGSRPDDEQRSETAQALLDAAESLFSTRGYAAVGIRDIAERAQANIASIKYHFGSKRDLYLATMRESMSRRTKGDPWVSLMPELDTRAEAARALVCFFRAFIEEALGNRPPRSCAMLMTHEALQPSEALDDVVRDYIRPRMDLLERAIGMLRPRSAPEERSALAAGVLSQILYYVVFRSFAERVPNLKLNEPDAVSRIADTAAAFSLRGLGLPDDEIARAFDAAPDGASQESR